ncbi:MAG: DUF928 domain-containing protein [Cyanobacteria bacterium J06621_11]
MKTIQTSITIPIQQLAVKAGRMGHVGAFILSLAISPVIALASSLGNLLATASVLAQTYQPPAGEPPSGPYISNGSRTGCGEQFNVPLTALVPRDHVGQTTSTAPTLAWFVPTIKPYRIGLSIYQINEDGQPEFLHQLEYVETDESASTIASLTVPEETISLTPGQHYLWEVGLACQPESPLYDQSFVAEIAITSPSTPLTIALNRAQTPQQQSTIYAGNGYWYDALQAALQIADPHERAQMLNTLFNDLADLEEDLHRQRLLDISEILHHSQLPTSINELQ